MVSGDSGHITLHYRLQVTLICWEHGNNVVPSVWDNMIPTEDSEQNINLVSHTMIILLQCGSHDLGTSRKCHEYHENNVLITLRIDKKRVEIFVYVSHFEIISQLPVIFTDV